MATHETAPLLYNPVPFDRDPFDDGRSRNVIMMVSDGFGPASQTYARSYYQFIHPPPKAKMEYISPLDKILVGTSRTKSSDSLITDSAAGATAFSCALKTYNDAVAIDSEGLPCGTILEAAKDLRMLTGVVVTSRVTHATPASFSAHVPHRDMESEIAAQQIGDYILGRQVDLILGGGRCFFTPNSTEGSCRNDSRDLIKESKSFGWNKVMLNKDDFVKLDQENEGIPLPAIGLFHQDHMSFEIDRDPSKEPSLKEMTLAALKSLKGNAGPNQGFFLLIEGSRIDMAAHNNDPVAHVHDILQYHETVAAVRKFVANNPDTLLISTSDHETGGFTIGYQVDPKVFPEYLWKPEVIKRANASTEILTNKLIAYRSELSTSTGEHGGNNKDLQKFVKAEILAKGLGITDATEQEISFLTDPNSSSSEITPFLGHMISHRAQLGWTTVGHTGVDVNLYAEGDNEGVKELTGNRENTEIGVAMSNFLKVDLNYITKKLQLDSEKWYKPISDLWTAKSKLSQHQKTGR
ncbi:vacuolar alkaline phosphatase [Haplosporangium sp. Z 27]|nr:vacuolar alkaline phosphatase [Haplosporangium sp. Z 27]